MNRLESVSTALVFLGLLSDKPKMMRDINKEIPVGVNSLWGIFKKLKKAKLVSSVRGQGLLKVPGATYDEEMVRRIFNCSVAGETKLITCNICNVKKARIFKEARRKKYIYTNEEGKRWYGRQCPDCFVSSETYYGTPADALSDPMTKRKCRACQKFLPQSRYLKCYECQPALPSLDEDYMFHGEGLGFVDDLDLGDLEYEID